MVKVSVVTISFNQAEFLERTIRSVLNQDYQNIEYIVVDPGSTDGSRELIESYGSRIARTIFEPDAGAADGLNKGFASTTGDILSFLNSDDVFLPGAVSAAVSFFAKNPAVDVVSGHARVIGPDDRVLRLVYLDRMFVIKYVYGGVALIQPSTFFRRIAYARTKGFNPGNRVTWDGELFLDMALAGCRFGRSHDIWSGYRLHSQSITVSGKLEDTMNRVNQGHFLRVMGREPNGIDKKLKVGFQIWKHLMNPRDTLERILRGPVFQRKAEKQQTETLKGQRGRR